MFGQPHAFGHPLIPQMSLYFQTPPCMSLGVEFSFTFLQWHLSLCLDVPHAFGHPLMPQMSPYFQTPPCDIL